MHVSYTGRVTRLAEVTDERGVGFGKCERFSGRFEVEFLGVTRIVESESENDAGDDGREPDDGAFGNEAAIVETE
jgi:hypothetical protein